MFASSIEFILAVLSVFSGLGVLLLMSRDSSTGVLAPALGVLFCRSRVLNVHSVSAFALGAGELPYWHTGTVV
jgi:hypothetical protein